MQSQELNPEPAHLKQNRPWPPIAFLEGLRGSGRKMVMAAILVTDMEMPLAANVRGYGNGGRVNRGEDC